VKDILEIYSQKDMTPNSLMDMKRSHRYTKAWTYPDIIKELNNYYA